MKVVAGLGGIAGARPRRSSGLAGIGAFVLLPIGLAMVLVERTCCSATRTACDRTGARRRRRSRSTRTRRRILPRSDRGISSMNSTRRTFLYEGTCSETYDISSPSVTSAPGVFTTKAFGTSPALASGAGIDGRVGHARVLEQQRLELGGRHLEPAVLDQLLQPVHHVEVAVRRRRGRCRRCGAIRRPGRSTRSPRDRPGSPS